MRFPSDLFTEALRLPDNALIYEVAQRVRGIAQDHVVLQTQDYDFQPIEYAEAAGCSLRTRNDVQGIWNAEWHDDQMKSRPVHAAFDVEWQGQKLTIVRVYLDAEPTFWLVVAESISLCERFFIAVCKWYSVSSSAITVFDFGCFSRDEELLEQIAGRTFDSLVMSPKMQECIQKDILDFFNLENECKEQGIPWKRGVILHGPPGNGKTRTIQAVVNKAKVPVIYVRSLVGRNTSSAMGLKAVFERARNISPCIVVMEDLDSMVNPSNRSYFLNEIDGFSMLDGVLILATTNHLDKLDVAIKDRPSRFDVKLEFGNPTESERAAYIRQATQSWASIQDEQLASVAKLTKGFSFAAMQELCRSATMQLRNQPFDPFKDLIPKPIKKRKKEKSAK